MRERPSCSKLSPDKIGMEMMLLLVALVAGGQCSVLDHAYFADAFLVLCHHTTTTTILHYSACLVRMVFKRAEGILHIVMRATAFFRIICLVGGAAAHAYD